MNKSKLKYLLIVLVPNIILALYVLCANWADHYARTRYIGTYKFLVAIIGNALLGVYLMLVCKYTFNKSNHTRWPSEYLLGVIIMPLLLALAYIPALNMYNFIFFAFDCIPQYFIILAVYIGLFVHAVRHKRLDQINSDNPKYTD